MPKSMGLDFVCHLGPLLSTRRSDERKWSSAKFTGQLFSICRIAIISSANKIFFFSAVRKRSSQRCHITIACASFCYKNSLTDQQTTEWLAATGWVNRRAIHADAWRTTNDTSALSRGVITWHETCSICWRDSDYIFLAKCVSFEKFYLYPSNLSRALLKIYYILILCQFVFICIIQRLRMWDE